MLIELLNGNITDSEYLLENNARIIYNPLPKKVYGFVMNYRDLFLIVVNSFISSDKKKKTILHEFAHIELSHLDKRNFIEFKIEDIEDEADEYVKYLYEECNLYF